MNPATQTPLVATITTTVLVLVLALWLPIVALAKTTSTILLLIYATVNLSLVMIKCNPKTKQPEGPNGPSYPIAMPIFGIITCVGFLIFHAVVTLTR